MLTITLNLPKEVERQLEKDFHQLEIITKKSKGFHIEKAVIRYLEHANKLLERYNQEGTKGSRKYTIEELLEQLNLKEVDWEK